MKESRYYSANRVKVGLRNFAVGRTLNGLGGLVLLFLVVRGLSTVEYGNYVVLLASVELLAMVSSLGLYGFAQRYIPEFRVRGSHALLIRSIALGLSVRALTLFLCAVILLGFQDKVASTFDLSITSLGFMLFASWLLIEGTCRWLDNVTESLLLQGLTQISVTFRTWTKVVGVAILTMGAGASLEALLWLELLGSCLALGAVLLMLFRGIRRSMSSEVVEFTPQWRTIAAFSHRHYAALLFGQVYGYNTLKLLLSALAGASVTAAYGFAQSLADILRRYLPAQLLIGMVRPLVVVSYSESKDAARPIFLSNVVMKLNVFLAAPCLLVGGMFGADLIAIVDQGRYPGAHLILVALLAILVLQTLHSGLGMMATALEHADLILRATVAACVGLICAALLIPVIGVYGALVGAAVSECAYCLVVASGIRARHRGVAVLNWHGHSRIWMLAILSAAVAWIGVSVAPLPGTMMAITGTFITICGYVLVAYRWKPFSETERSTLNRVLAKPVFVW